MQTLLLVVALAQTTLGYTTFYGQCQVHWPAPTWSLFRPFTCHFNLPTVWTRQGWLVLTSSLDSVQNRTLEQYVQDTTRCLDQLLFYNELPTHTAYRTVNVAKIAAVGSGLMVTCLTSPMGCPHMEMHPYELAATSMCPDIRFPSDERYVGAVVLFDQHRMQRLQERTKRIVVWDNSAFMFDIDHAQEMFERLPKQVDGFFNVLLLLVILAVATANKGGPDPNGQTIINGRVFKGNPGYHAVSQALAKGFRQWPKEFSVPINASTNCPTFNSKNLGWDNVDEYLHVLKVFGPPKSKNWPSKLTQCLETYCTKGNADIVCHLHPSQQMASEAMNRELKHGKTASIDKT